MNYLISQQNTNICLRQQNLSVFSDNDPIISFLKIFLFLNGISYEKINDFISFYEKNEITAALQLFDKSETQIQLMNLNTFIKNGFFEFEIYNFLKDKGSGEKFIFYKKIRNIAKVLSNQVSERIEGNINLFFKNLILFYILYEIRNSWTRFALDFYKTSDFRWQTSTLNNVVFESNRDFDKILTAFIRFYVTTVENDLTYEDALKGFFFKRSSKTFSEFSGKNTKFALTVLKQQLTLNYLPLYKHLYIVKITPDKHFISANKDLFDYFKSLNYKKIKSDAYVVFDAQVFKDLNFFYSGNGVYFKPPVTSFLSNEPNALNVLNNECYNRPIWIEKGDEVKMLESFPKEQQDFFFKEVSGLDNFVDAINYLQGTRFEINLHNLKFLKEVYSNFSREPDEDWENFFFGLDPLESFYEEDFIDLTKDPSSEKKVNLPKNIEFIGDELLKTPQNTSKLDRLINALVTIEELGLITELNPKGFYYAQACDMRSRTYPKASVATYQNSRITRALAKPIQKEMNIEYATYSFLTENPVLFEYKSFNYQHLDISSLRDLFEFAANKFPKEMSSARMNELLTTTLSSSTFLFHSTTILLIEQLCDVFFRFGDLRRTGSNKKDYSAIVSQGIILARELLDITNDRNLMKFTKKEVSKEKKFWEFFFLFKGFLSFWSDTSKWLDLCWYNDASSNVVQLVFFKNLITDQDLLRVSNIFNNDTVFTGIYDCVASSIREELNFSWVSADLIKATLMPGIYGQTFYSLRTRLDKELTESYPLGWGKLLTSDENCYFPTVKPWANMEKNDRNKKINAVLKSIEEAVWLFFDKRGILLKDYLMIFKDMAKKEKNCLFLNYMGMPINIYRYFKSKPETLVANKKKIYVVKKKIKGIQEQGELYELAVFELFQEYLKKKDEFSALKQNNGIEKEREDRENEQFEESFVPGAGKKEKSKQPRPKKFPYSDFKKFILKFNMQERGLYFKENRTLLKNGIKHSIPNDFKNFSLSGYLSWLDDQEKKINEELKLRKADDKRKYLNCRLKAFALEKDSYSKGGEDITFKIRKRYHPLTSKIDIWRLQLALAPASNHAEDAGLLLTTVLRLGRRGVRVSAIHDSIGSHIGYSYLIKMTFKLENINFVQQQFTTQPFPFSEIIKDYDSDPKIKNLIEQRERNKVFYERNFHIFKKEIIESRRFFN